MKQLEQYSDSLDKIKSKAFRKLIETDERIVAFSKELDGVFIYTNSKEWDNGDGSGTFKGDTESQALRYYKDNVQKNNEGRE